MRKNQVAEVLRLKEQHDLLLPDHVVAFARDPATALHSWFEWDDGVAAERYRLQQAGNIIRLAITVYADETKVHKIRALVSLPSDRANGGGYRSTMEVLHDSARRAEMLQEALAILTAASQKYAHLKELAGVWAAVRQAEEKIEEATPLSSAE